jgi:Pyruvate/2-oxoacid:ferredoxin oxidoreductase delta subunit
MINEMMRDVPPFMNVLSTGEPQTTTILVNQVIEPGENIVFPTKRVLSIFEQLDENETITIGTCFCRFQKQLIDDHCRTELPLETCISIGPAAEHLKKQGMAQQINKADAISRIKKFQENGAIHQTTPTIPVKDFQAKYPYDRFCNCCWDCCTLIGAYNRGQMPYMLKRYHKAVIPDPEACTGCEECISYCPTSAISMNSSGKAEIKDEFCIGCGHCYYQCSPGAFELIEDERNVFLPMQDKSQARIKSEFLEEDSSEDQAIDEIVISDRNEVLETLNKYRQKYEAEENIKTFKKWNKTLQYYFTDLDEYWSFELKEGVPSALKEGRVENPDIFYSMPGTVYIGLFRGEVDFMKAMRKGIIKVDAPLKDLIELGKIV